MLQLYFWPMACSLASRIALMEAGIEARYHLVHLRSKKVLEDGIEVLAVSARADFVKVKRGRPAVAKA